MAQAFGVGGFGALEDQVRRNMEMFERTFSLFAPFARRENQAREETESGKMPRSEGEIGDLKRQLEEMQRRLDEISDPDKS
jgi:polyhydroxyalkanoate synthesis regulator protein